MKGGERVCRKDELLLASSEFVRAVFVLALMSVCCQRLCSAFGSAGCSVTVEPEKCFHVGMVSSLVEVAQNTVQFQQHLKKNSC